MIIGSNILFFEDLPSTNTKAAELLKNNNPPEGTLIYTNYQSEGRGYSGNKWESESGKNLLFSILLYPSFINPEEQFQISMTISLAICDFLMRFIPDCSIKWPNDIYVNNDKIAGILIESSVTVNKIESTIAGIGLNINQEKFPGTVPNPVSLHLLTGIHHDLSACLNQLGNDLDKRYKQLIAGNSELIKEEYVSKLFRLNKWCEFRDINGIYTGKILTASDNGLIKIKERTGEIREYNFKEVDFIL